MSLLNALVSNDNHCAVNEQIYKARPPWELTVMLGRLAAIGLSYYHQRALCWNNEILHKNMFSWPFFHSIFIYDFICKMCKNDKLKWYCAVLIWFASYWAPNHMSNYSETCKLHWNQIRVWSESADVIRSLLVYSTSQTALHISFLTTHLPDRSCIGRWNSLSGRGIKTCALLEKLGDSFINYYLTREEFRTI